MFFYVVVYLFKKFSLGIHKQKAAAGCTATALLPGPRHPDPATQARIRLGQGKAYIY
jgi:hypothetical protein